MWQSLEAPHTFLYTGPLSSAGERINAFGLSLKHPDNRTAFHAGPDVYLERFSLTPAERALITERDWTGLLHAGGHLQAILKIAATLGETLWHIGAHCAGMSVEQMKSSCPRRRAGLPPGFP